MANIDNLEIQITANADSAASAINRLSSGCDRLHTSASSAASGTSELAAGAKDAGTATHEAGAEAGSAEPTVRRFGRSAEEAGKNAKKGTAGISDFWKALKRVAYYRIIRSIIKEITSAFSEGIKNLYHWSDIMGGHFAKNMDRLATSTQYLKNGLGTLVAPLIEAVIPAIEWFIDVIVEGINYFNMFIAAISGKSSYTAAKKVAAVWDDSSTKTAKNAKKTADEMKKTILAFDEINKLVKPTDSSGSGGGTSGKKQPNYAAMFEERKLSGGLASVSNATSKWLATEIGKIENIIDTSLMAVGLILTLSGKPAIGIGLMAAGALNKGANIVAYSDTISPRIKAAISGILGIAGIGLAIGAVLAFSSANVPLGIGLLAASVGALSGSFKIAKVNWDAISEILRGKIGALTAIISGASLVLGILALIGNHIPLGIGLILAGAGGLAATVSANWGNMLDLGRKAIEKVKEGWDSIKAKFPIALSLSNTVEGLWKFVKDTWSVVSKVGLGVAVFISTAIGALWEGLKSIWNTVTSGKFLDVVVTIATKAADLFADFLRGWNALGNKALDIGVHIVNGAAKWWADVTSFWKDFTKDLSLDAALDFVITPVVKIGKRIWNGVGDFWQWLWYGSGDESESNASQGGIKKFSTNNIFFDSAKGIATSFNTLIDRFAKDLLNRSYEISLNLAPGKGFNGVKNTGPSAFTLDREIKKAIESDPLEVTADLEPGSGFIQSWLLDPEIQRKLDKTPLVVPVDANTIWGKTANAALRYLGLASLATDISAYLKQTWGRGANGAINSLGLGNLWTTISVYLEPKTKEIRVASGGGGTWRLYTKANGGVLSNGAWSDIPQYAGGTYNAMHGSLFWAGERGAEVVGHANGRTEVLNRSQIASAIYSAVNAAMAPASANFAAAASNMANTEAGYDMDGLADMVRQGVEGALERQREILRQQTEYLRQINDKEFKAEVTTASINSAQTRFNRRAGVTVVPVG